MQNLGFLAELCMDVLATLIELPLLKFSIKFAFKKDISWKDAFKLWCWFILFKVIIYLYARVILIGIIGFL